MPKHPAAWTTIQRHRHKLTRHPDVLEAYQDFKSRLAARGRSLEDHVKTTVLKGRRGPVFVPNEFPYWVADGIQHWVLWSAAGPLSAEEIRVAVTAQRPVGVRHAYWFENPPAAKTIPGIWHVHVFLRS